MIDNLRAVLTQLEAAGGSPDPEARQKLQELQQQLEQLERARERASVASRPASTSTNGLAGDAAVLQHMERLAVRLDGVEQQVAGLDDGSRALLQQSLAAMGETASGTRVLQDMQPTNGSIAAGIGRHSSSTQGTQ